jgi:uncharacterized protein (UPF0332 family)
MFAFRVVTRKAFSISAGLNVLSFEQWKSNSKSSLDAARILLEHGQPIEAASRAYDAAYQMVTGVLLRLKLSPRST